MLSLAADFSNNQDKPPKYIQLSLGQNVIGRGYKSHIKFLHYPWISRKHLTITKVDSQHFLEAYGRKGVFVNKRRVTFKTLCEGDSIIIGGSSKDLPIDGILPASPGPYVEYIYSRISKITDRGHIYKEPNFNPADLIVCEEDVNGRLVKETYHSQDFENTLDEEDIEPSLALLSNASSTLSSIPPNMPVNDRPVRAKKPRKDFDIYSCPTSKPKKRNSTSLNTTGAKDNEIKGISSSTKLNGTDNVQDKQGDKSRLDTSALNTSNKEILQCPFEVDLTANDNLEPVNSSKKGRKVSLEKKKISTKTATKPTVPKTSTITKPATVSDPVDDDWAAFNRVAASVDRTLEIIDKKIAAKSNGDIVAKDTTEKEKGAEDNLSDCEELLQHKRMRPQRSVKLLKKNYCDEDEKDENTNTKKDSKKKDDDKPFIPVDDGSNELPDIDDFIYEEIVPSSSKEKRNSKNAFEILQQPKRMKTKGRNSKVNAREASVQSIIDQWQTMPKPILKSKWIEVLNGKYRRILYGFEDKSIFQVTYKNVAKSDGPSSNTHLWDSEEYDVSVKINIPVLRDRLLAGTLDDGDKTRVFKIVKNQMKRAKMKDYDKARMLPHDYVIQQPDEVRLKLKQYQLDALSWMKCIEDRVDRGFTATKLVKWEEAELDLGFDVVHNRVFVPPLPVSKNTILTVKAKGGILADQMGLGKTITLLGLIALNKANMPRIPSPSDFNYQETFCLPTAATLVVAPSHLTGQWKDEIETHTDLTVHLITTKYQYEKLKYIDILEANVVVVSVQFLLTNKVFTKLATGIECETEFMQLMRKPGINPLLQNSPNLMHFKWWRIIADEAHEIMTFDTKHVKQSKSKGSNYSIEGSPGLRTLEKFPSVFRWYVTGTPFPHAEKSLRAALKFLEVKVDDPKLEYPDGSLQVDKYDYMEDFSDQGLFLYPLHNLIYNNLYVRNTKSSIGGDYDVPEYVEELILLSMGDIERGIYDRSVSEIERRQLCCHLQIAARIQSVAGVQQKSLEEVRVALVEQANRDIDRTKKVIEGCEKDVKDAKNEKKDEVDVRRKNVIQARIQRLEDTIKRHGDELVKHQSALSYFDGIVPRITHNADEPCVICLENIERLTVTPCGHLYCRKCILQCLQGQGLCPTCRKQVHERQLLEVKDSERGELAKSAELKDLTEKYGTKMAYLIFYLRNLFKAEGESRVIIFSQWDTLLQKIGETLNENCIQNVFVKGNVHVRNKAIMSFRKQEKTRVIMLSLQNAASGTNLVEATHVVLIDPVAGSSEEAVAIESQAIGRAHRMGQQKQISVVRMIMKDTIEHELYKRNSAEDTSIQQVDFNFEQQAAFGGPQISRRTCKVPEPDPEVLQAALRKQQDDAAAVSATANRRGRALYFLQDINRFSNALWDAPDPDDYYDDNYSDNEYDSYEDRREDCCIS